MGRPRKHPKTEKAPKASSALIAVERAYDHLRSRAISFDIRPGDRIDEVFVSSHLGMSRAPVREALNRLVMNGLMDFEPGRGFFGRKLSLKEVTELLAVRADLELPALRIACATASDESIAELKRQWEEIAAKQETMDIEELVDCDELFHLRLAELGDNAERIKFMKNINDRIRFIRRINLEAEGRRAMIINEHTEILTALAKRDEENAARLLGHHLVFCPDILKTNVFEGIARIYAGEVI